VLVLQTEPTFMLNNNEETIMERDYYNEIKTIVREWIEDGDVDIDIDFVEDELISISNDVREDQEEA
jgi:hypothetical protein